MATGRPDNADGRVIVVTGATGSGKTAWIKRRIGNRPVFIWDPKPDYIGGRYPVKNLITCLAPAQLVDLVASRRARIAYHVPVTREAFIWWSRCAWVWAQIHNGVIIAEEIADVTSPGKAPPGWGDLVRKIRATGCDLYAVTQRPSESDKTAIGNASVLHVCRMSRAADRVYMARELDVSPEQLAGLKCAPRRFDFVERDMLSLKVTRSTLII